LTVPPPPVEVVLLVAEVVLLKGQYRVFFDPAGFGVGGKSFEVSEHMFVPVVAVAVADVVVPVPVTLLVDVVVVLPVPVVALPVVADVVPPVPPVFPPLLQPTTTPALMTPAATTKDEPMIRRARMRNLRGAPCPRARLH